MEVLAKRRTSRGHFVSAPLGPDVVRALVQGAARAGRSAGGAAAPVSANGNGSGAETPAAPAVSETVPSTPAEAEKPKTGT